MAIQTTYSDAPAIGYAGQVATNSPLKHCDSYVNDSDEILPYGIGVVRTGERLAAPPTAVTDPFVGVVIRSEMGDAGVQLQQMMSVMSSGDVYVMPEQSVAYGDPVYMRVTATGDEVAGSFRKDADGGDAVRVQGASWYRAGSTSSPAVLRLRLTGAETISEVGAEETYVVPHGAVTADTTVYAFTVPAGRTFILDSVTYLNPTGLAQDAANYFDIKVVRGATVMANWSTLTGAQGSIAADTVVTLVNASLANRTAPGGTRIDVVLDETGTASLPAGTVTIHGRLI